jgi:tryptophan halogenase
MLQCANEGFRGASRTGFQSIVAIVLVVYNGCEREDLSTMPTPIRSVLVVGEGSAGLLAALALKTRFPELDVRILASSRKPIIGVGESTTGAIPFFLHTNLEIEPGRFHRAVSPTWKVGLRFERWGSDATNSFNFAFDRQILGRDPRLSERLGVYYGSLGRDLALSSALIRRNKSPVVRDRLTGEHRFHPYGYHIENQRFTAFLGTVAKERGIRFHDGELRGILTDQSGAIGSVQIETGESFTADLFVDCTGFSSLFLKHLGVKFISYSNALACDRAIVGEWARDEPIRPCTTCTTMECGWMWRIEHVEKINQAYVFSSSHISEDEARAEYLRETKGSPSQVRTIRFPSGRYETCWLKNVVAVGNASGFVEPLESTGLHMIASQVRWLVRDLGQSMLCPDAGRIAAYNTQAAQRWDDVRDFIAIHYKFNRTSGSEFWRWCNSSMPLGSLQGFVDTYEETGPALASVIPDPAEQGFAVLPQWSIFGFAGYLTLLLGMRVPSRVSPAIADEDRRRCGELWTLLDEKAEGALTIEEAMAAIHEGQLNHPVS